MPGKMRKNKRQGKSLALSFEQSGAP